MADTDDEQLADLEPDHRAKGEDDETPGETTVGEDRRAKEWEAGADLPRPDHLPEVVDEELEAGQEAERQDRRNRDQIELDDREERERQDTRRRHDVQQTDAEVAEALRLANVHESTGRNFRSREVTGREAARKHDGRAALLREGAAGRDDPQARADRSTADRLARSGQDRRNAANADASVADWHGAEGQAYRREAEQLRRPEQGGPEAPAADAARIPPKEPTVGQSFIQRKRRRKLEGLKDIGLGD